jgi:hypothetical protein
MLIKAGHIRHTGFELKKTRLTKLCAPKEGILIDLPLFG